MHFLDFVFPLQYPIYQLDAVQGGRGWLLALLLHHTPLCHAALALSTFHRHTLMSSNMTRAQHMAERRRQEYHLGICLDQVHRSASSSCTKDGLGIAAAVTELLFFEVLDGSSIFIIKICQYPSIR